MPLLSRILYHALIALGRPIGGIRPRRMYDALGRRAYPRAEYRWVKNRWGHELLLSHHFHLDRNILIFGDYDHELHELFVQRVKPGMTVLDVGANLGEMALHLGSLVGKGGKVYAFEPFPAAYARLVAHLERNKLSPPVEPLRLALSNVTGELTMSAPGADADNQGIGSIVNRDAGRMPAAVTIGAMMLDDFVRERGVGSGGGKIDFVKLDIQGAEYFFLEGGRETLRRDRPELVMEVSPGDLRGVGKTSRDLVELVETLGYRVFELEGGGPGRALRGAEVAADFASTNILCLPAS